MKEKERERKDLEETVDLLRMELNKMEEARKEASIKVQTRIRSGDVIVSVQPVRTDWSLVFRLHLWSCRGVSWSRG